mmetsp:Transcript_76872/g.238100  ORF Transcript_76872/g.238100 Transcript_76872/m.238100 type:complete len:262 (+) Transcript_76872:258-1043(+)
MRGAGGLHRSQQSPVVICRVHRASLEAGAEVDGTAPLRDDGVAGARLVVVGSQHAEGLLGAVVERQLRAPAAPGLQLLVAAEREEGLSCRAGEEETLHVPQPRHAAAASARDAVRGLQHRYAANVADGDLAARKTAKRKARHPEGAVPALRNDQFGAEGGSCSSVARPGLLGRPQQLPLPRHGGRANEGTEDQADPDPKQEQHPERTDCSRRFPCSVSGRLERTHRSRHIPCSMSGKLVDGDAHLLVRDGSAGHVGHLRHH